MTFDHDQMITAFEEKFLVDAADPSCEPDLEIWCEAWQAACAAMPSAPPESVDVPVAYMTHHDEPMLFTTHAEAASYCDDDEEPIPLYASPPTAEPVAGEPNWRPFGLTVEHALNRGDDAALLFDENSPIRGELRRLLAHPPAAERKPLSEDQITDIWADVSTDRDDGINIHEFARAIEAAHGIKEQG